MRLPDFLRTSTFRLAAGFSVTFAGSAVLLFAFIYWQTAVYETARIDRFLVTDAAMIARQRQQEVYRAVSLRNLGDLHRITYAALFDADGRLRVGNLAEPPRGLPLDGLAHVVTPVPVAPDGSDPGAAQMVGRRLPGGRVLVIGRNVDALRTLREIVLHALELGVIPALLLAIAAGAFVSWRARRRVQAVHQAAERILYGELRERLPVRGTGDDFDRLARSVNLMLDEIGRLLDSVKAAGYDIAHGLRTPLARLRSRLERGKAGAAEEEDLRRLADGAVSELDQTLGAITTLLRIAEIEAGQRRATAETFDLGALVDEVGQIYQPLAEEAGSTVAIETQDGLAVTADRGLMLEAIANLVQNAIKFTPAGGTVRLIAAATPEGPAVRIADTGPGIPPEARGRVFERFYRVAGTATAEGSGLGLSLVAAIARFHGFGFAVDGAEPGAIFTILCRPRPMIAPAG